MISESTKIKIPTVIIKKEDFNNSNFIKDRLKLNSYPPNDLPEDLKNLKLNILDISKEDNNLLTLIYNEQNMDLIVGLIKTSLKIHITTNNNNYLTYCLLQSLIIHSRTWKITKKKKNCLSTDINFLVNGYNYKMSNAEMDSKRTFTITSECSISLTSQLKANIFLIDFENTMIDCKFKIDNMKYVKVPCFIISKKIPKNRFKFKIYDPLNTLKTIDLSYFILSDGINIIEYIEYFIQLNSHLENLQDLYVDLIYKITKYSLEDLDFYLTQLLLYYFNRYNFNVRIRISLAYPIAKFSSIYREIRYDDFAYIPFYIQGSNNTSSLIMSIYLCKKSPTSCLKKLHNYIFRKIFRFIGTTTYHSFEQTIQLY